MISDQTFNSQIMGLYEICRNTHIFFLYDEVSTVVKVVLPPSSGIIGSSPSYCSYSPKVYLQVLTLF